ncbi:hypothetical protein [uncultured Pseudoteredinibacter sp.]|uniref:hypothetical protein n=1 Tax=uncultured Pseudoteredinibacter sp. TaxID=1641701 RepID=UPI002622C53B|nr:hypothetical protein [uncultured Pseudoteredinibacter sp.]
MKEGDYYQLLKNPGWYIWLKHKIIYQDGSPMNLGEGAWIIGLYNSQDRNKSEELIEFVSKIRKDDEIKMVARSSVSHGDIVWPKFNMVVNGEGGVDRTYLCCGYEVVEEVRKIKRDVRFSFGMSLSTISRVIEADVLWKYHRDSTL